MGGDVVFKPGVPGFPPGASCRAVPKKPPAEAWGLRVAGRRAADEIAEGRAVGAVHLHVPAEAVADPGEESWGELGSFLDIARRVVAKQALAIEKRMPADALPPVSLYRELAACGSSLSSAPPGGRRRRPRSRRAEVSASTCSGGL